MRLSLTKLLCRLVLASTLTASACGKDPAPPAAAPSAQAPAAPADPAAAPASGDASTTPTAEVFVFATIGTRQVTNADIEAEVKKIPKDDLDAAAVHDVVAGFIEDTLLAEDARKQGFQTDAKDDAALAEAYAKERFSAEATKSVTDADLTKWFEERRSVARIVFRDEAAAQKARAEIEASLGGPEAAAKADKAKVLEAFMAAKPRRRNELVPDGVLVDARGQTEVGDQVIPEDGAKLLFSLQNDGEISQPAKVGDLWILVLRLGVRPGTPLEGVPGDQRDAAKEKLVAKRANELLEEHIERLKRDQGVRMDEMVVRKYTRSLGVENVGRLKRLPFGQRKGLTKQRVPNRAPIPGGRDVDRMLQERANQERREQGDKGPTTPGATP